MGNDKRRADRAEQEKKLKECFPSMTADQCHTVIQECGHDNARLNAWIDENFGSPQWQVAGKQPKRKGDDPKSKGKGRSRKEGNGDAYSNRKARSYEGVPFAIAKNKHPIIIGPGGKTIQALNRDCAVKINVPDRDSELPYVFVVGDATQVKAAHRKLEELLHVRITQLESVGAVVLQIEKLAQVDIKLDADFARQFHVNASVHGRDSPLPRVLLDGQIDNVHRAREELEARCRDLGEGAQPIVLLNTFDPSTVFKTVRVANISPATTATSLKNHFRGCGKLGDVQIDTSTSPPTGVVILESVKGIQSAMTKMHSSILQGSKLSVHSDTERRSLPPSQNSAPAAAAPATNGAAAPVEELMVAPLGNTAEDMKASVTADEIIEKLTTDKDYSIQTVLCQLPLSTANTVQILMRIRLRDRLAQQHMKVAELDAKHVDDVRRGEQVTRELSVKNTLRTQLATEIQKLQQRLAGVDVELSQLQQEEQSLQDVLQRAHMAKSAEAQIAERLLNAQHTAETAARGVTHAWAQWLSKLSSNSFADWNQSDLNTLLHCLGIDSQLFVSNGIEPSMLACIDDALLRELRWNDQSLSFGERRYFIIAVRALLTEKRPPLVSSNSAQLPSVRDVVTYLMCFGLKVNLDPHQHHLIQWSTADVCAHFHSLGLSKAAAACKTQCVNGAVIWTMSRKDCFSLEMGCLGDTIQMWHELIRLHSGRSAPEPTGKASSVFKWSVADVVANLKKTNNADLGEICEREKISGPVLLSIERMDDLQQVEFSRPGDRIRMLQICRQHAAQ